MFSHGPMSGARGAKGLVWYIFSYAKGAKLGLGAMAPVAPPGSVTVKTQGLSKDQQESMLLTCLIFSLVKLIIFT